jgi:NAD(P)-dependent dehydrogenase (short-subunit alcohol dehydrogenase family)
MPDQLDPEPGFADPPRQARRTILLAGALSAAALLAGCADEVAEPGEMPGETTAMAPDQPVILITGSTGGMGRELALELGSTGAHIIVHGRNAERGMEVVQAIEEEGIGSARFLAADLASFDEVREFAQTILSEYDRLDVLVNNAGIGRGVDQTLRETSFDGHELRFQVNYLSGFLLTHELLPLIRNSAPARIVNVASGAQTPIDFDDVMLEEEYDGSRAYAQSKLAQVLFTFDLAEDLEGTGVTVNTLHPATMMPTTMVLERGGEPVAEIEEGVEAVLHLVTEPELESGQYFVGTSPSRANAQAYDEGARRELRELSRELTGM